MSVFTLSIQAPGIESIPGGAWGLFLIILGAAILISIILKSPPFKALAAIFQALAVRIGGRVYVEQQQIEKEHKLKMTQAKLAVAELKESLTKRITDVEAIDIKKKLPSGTVTILFSDIEDWTPLAEQGDESAFALLQQHHRLVRQAIKVYQGLEVKSYGDGFMIAFPSAKKAILCAREIQGAMDEFNRGPEQDRSIRLRIGINSGEPIQQGEDYIGRAVNLASRIQNEARGGQILIGEVVKNLAGPIQGVQYIDRGFFKLQGIEEKQRLYEVLTVQPLAPGPAALNASDLKKSSRSMKDTDT